MWHKHTSMKHCHNQGNEYIHPPKKVSYPFIILLPFPFLPPPFPRQLVICFLSPWISLHSIEFHMSGIIQYALFLSGFFHSAQSLCNLSTSLGVAKLSLFIAESISLNQYISICLFTYLLMDMWVVFSFFAITNKAAMNIHVQVFVWAYSFVR